MEVGTAAACKSLDIAKALMENTKFLMEVPHFHCYVPDGMLCESIPSLKHRPDSELRLSLSVLPAHM